MSEINLTEQVIDAIINKFLSSEEIKNTIIGLSTAALFNEFNSSQFKKEMMEKLYKDFKESIKKET